MQDTASLVELDYDIMLIYLQGFPAKSALAASLAASCSNEFGPHPHPHPLPLASCERLLMLMLMLMLCTRALARRFSVSLRRHAVNATSNQITCSISPLVPSLKMPCHALLSIPSQTNNAGQVPYRTSSIGRFVRRSGKFAPRIAPGSPLRMYSRTSGLGRAGPLLCTRGWLARRNASLSQYTLPDSSK